MSNPGPATQVSGVYVGGGSPVTIGNGQTSGVVAPINVPGTQSNSLFSTASTGVVIKYQTAIIPLQVAATTAVQNTSSVTTNIQVGYQFATSSVYAVNKPTHQAGLGIGGVFCGTSGIINVNYSNVSNGATTPTGEANDVLEFRTSPITTTATLSPSPVPVNTTTEQVFTVTGGICLPGTVALVNKPSNQTALCYSPFARVVGVNQVAVTFGVITSGAVTTAITPTAAEAYSFAFLPNCNAYSPTVIYGIGAAQQATTASSMTEQTSAVTGTLGTDTVSGISKPAIQATTSVIGGRVTSAGVVGIAYANLFASQTPTSSEVYLCTIQKQQPLNPVVIYTQALNATTCAATTSVEATTTVTGLLVSSSVLVNKPTLTPGIMITNARVSAANTLAIQYSNFTTTSIAVPAETYTIANVQLQGPGLGYTTTAGLFVSQAYYPAIDQSKLMANALRSALISLNAISGN